MGLGRGIMEGRRDTTESGRGSGEDAYGFWERQGQDTSSPKSAAEGRNLELGGIYCKITQSLET